MAPHDTNTPKEAKRHAVPLIAMAAILAIVGVLLVLWLGYAVKEPETEAQTTDERITEEPGE